MNFTKTVIIGLCLALMAFSHGCSFKHKQSQAIEMYTINYDPLKPVTQKPLPFIISVEKFKAAPPYNTLRIIYSKDKFTQNRYHYHQWISEPNELITYLLARDIVHSNIVQAVLITSQKVATHHLEGTIDQIYEQDLNDKWNAVLTISITLTKVNETDVTKRICHQKSYSSVYPCEQKNPKGLARAMSMAMSKISEMIISDIYIALQ